jgi:hypothetical protein
LEKIRDLLTLKVLRKEDEIRDVSRSKTWGLMLAGVTEILETFWVVGFGDCEFGQIGELGMGTDGFGIVSKKKFIDWEKAVA